MKANVTKILFGVSFAALGIMVLGSVFDLWALASLNGWWTVFIIVPAIGSMFSSGVNLWNTGLLGLGIWLFIRVRDWIPNDKMNAIGLAIILLGVGFWLIFGNLKKKSKQTVNGAYIPAAGYDDKPDYIAVFSGSDQRNCSGNLRGGSATAVFGGIDADLSGATVLSDIKFDVTAIFGGVDLVVPENVRVEVKGLPLLGGCDNMVPAVNDDSLPIVTVNYFAFCGGVDIRTKNSPKK